MNLVRLQPQGGGSDFKPYKVTVNVDNEFNGTQITLYQGLTELKATAQNGKAEFYPLNSGVWRAKGVYNSYTYYDSENGVDLSYFGDTYSLTLTIGNIHITIDWESVFNGSACVLTNGNKTFNLTLGTSGSLLQTVDETGTWTATATAQSGQYVGQTFSGNVEVTSDGNYTISIVTILDGKTVTPTDDVQVWLKCGGINKNYTTLTEVISDDSTLNDLMANLNACDYLVRSTIFASVICTNQSAMTYIGLNNYCSRVLLSDKVWCTEICKSSYIDYVLNAKVPTLSSNNGKVIASDNTYPAWVVFNGSWGTSNGTFVSGQIYPTYSLKNGYVGYIFDSPINVRKFKINIPWSSADNHRRLKNYRIEGYDTTNKKWIPLYTGIVPDGRTNYLHDDIIVDTEESNGFYNQFRLYCVDQYATTGSTWIWIQDVQFYGRKEV